MLNEGADLKLLNVSDSIEATVISGPLEVLDSSPCFAALTETNLSPARSAQ
jgi:hypothetical protein